MQTNSMTDLWIQGAGGGWLHSTEVALALPTQPPMVGSRLGSAKFFSRGFSLLLTSWTVEIKPI